LAASAPLIEMPPTATGLLVPMFLSAKVALV
jgi:hypothetical protein